MKAPQSGLPKYLLPITLLVATLRAMYQWCWGFSTKSNGEWKFNAIGEPTKDKKLQETVQTVTQQYL
jgi:tellurium resistance protein TerZ